jgi:PAS domain S-box-containing protein
MAERERSAQAQRRKTTGALALRERDDQNRAVFEATSDGLVIGAAETGPAFCRTHGYTSMTGMHPTAFIHPDSHHLFAEYVVTVRQGREYRCQTRDVRGDGSVFDVEVLGREFTYRGPPAQLGVVRDIAELLIISQPTVD